MRASNTVVRAAPPEVLRWPMMKREGILNNEEWYNVNEIWIDNENILTFKARYGASTQELDFGPENVNRWTVSGFRYAL